ncbi:MAG: hypothetical protein JRF72_23180, partial [Deltaproteobacteria bacterium]|nr:hypothetical protein [Deltaproteobacteria bacterium]
MKQLIGYALVGMFLLGFMSNPVAAEGDIVKVMTQNQYLGADLTPLVTAQTALEFFAAADAALQQIASNNFPLRVRRFAKQVALTQPDVIALQETYNF